MSFIDKISDSNYRLSAFGQNNDKIYNPPTKEEALKTLKMIKEEKAKLKEAQRLKFEANRLDFEYLSNGVVLFKNINSKIIEQVFDKNSKDARAKEIRENLRCGTKILEPYVHQDKIYMAVIPVEIWKNNNFWRGMKEYWGSGQYGKDIADFAEDHNYANKGFNILFSQPDKMFKEKADGIPNVYLRRALYALYGLFRATIIVQILKLQPHVASISGGLYIVMFSTRVIFDFRGLADFFKTATWEEIWMFLGSFGALGVSGKGIGSTLKTLSGKKITIGKGGQLKTEPIKGSMTEQITKDTGASASDLQKLVKKQVAKNNTRFEVEKRMARFQEIIKDAEKKHAAAPKSPRVIAAEKMEEAYKYLKEGSLNAAADSFMKAARQLLTKGSDGQYPEGFNMRLGKIYKEIDAMLKKAPDESYIQKCKQDLDDLLKANKYKFNPETERVVKIKNQQ